MVAWAVSLAVEGHVSESTDIVLGFVVGAVVFVPSYVWLKRLRDGG